MGTETVTRTWGGKIADSIKGVIIGLILFLASFVVLWVNEGAIDVSKAAEKAVNISESEVDTANEGNLVSVYSYLTSTETLGDPGLLNPGNYLTLSRHVEMFAWVEHSESTTEKKAGGSETTTTDYTYEMDWTSMPSDSSSFYIPDGHYNPPMAYENASFRVGTATMGVYPVDMASLNLPGGEAITPIPRDVDYSSHGRIDNGYLYVGVGSISNPVIGDIRITYTAIPNPPASPMTLFGTLSGGTIVSYMYKDKKLYHARYGPPEEAVAKLHKEFTTTRWIVRLIGFLMMWIGLALFFGPINAVMDVLPFLGNVSRTVISIAMFVVAFVLSAVTIIVSMIAHNIIALIIVLAVIIGGVVLIAKARKGKKGAGEPGAAPTSPPEPPEK